jgi:catechol 2,3-dioxygenase-like lactoylglutathione lyase family enzyme
MTIQRMEHVGIVVDDLEAATAFFVELGLKLQGEGQVDRPRSPKRTASSDAAFRGGQGPSRWAARVFANDA